MSTLCHQGSLLSQCGPQKQSVLGCVWCKCMLCSKRSKWSLWIQVSVVCKASSSSVYPFAATWTKAWLETTCERIQVILKKTNTIKPGFRDGSIVPVEANDYWWQLLLCLFERKLEAEEIFFQGTHFGKSEPRGSSIQCEGKCAPW